MPVSFWQFLYNLLADVSWVVIGDRERCLQAGMDDHITSTSFVTFCRLGSSNVRCRASTSWRYSQCDQ